MTLPSIGWVTFLCVLICNGRSFLLSLFDFYFVIEYLDELKKYL